MAKTLAFDGQEGQLTAISLFAGCGGDTLGLERAGFNVIGFVEKWKPAIKSHLANFPDSKIIGEDVGGDITLIPDEEFLKFKGKIDLIFAGFPCQGFSHAGKKDPNDPRNKLFWEFVRATKLIEPKWVIGENVSGLMHRKTDDGESNVSDVIVSAFEGIGYKMAVPTVLKAADFKVPQKRRRVFFVGSRKGLSFEFPKPTLKKGEKIGIRNFIEFSLEGAVPFDPGYVEGPIKSFCESSSSKKPTGEPHPYLLLKLNDGKISSSKRVSPHHVEIVDLDAPAKTIHCGYLFQPRLFVPLKNKSGTFIRTMTVQELGQIQGFPKDFKFSGSSNNQIAQIGNAVPPALVEAIAKRILITDNSLAQKLSQPNILASEELNAPKFEQQSIPRFVAPC